MSTTYAKEFSEKYGKAAFAGKKGKEKPTMDDKLGRGQRVRLVRAMSLASRKDFFQQTGISPSTLQSWEDGKAGGLTAKGAHKLVKAVKKFGVVVSEQYLLSGVGNKPHFGEPRVFRFEKDGATVVIHLE